MNKCIVCGKETKNKKYCSIECKAKSMYKPKGNCLNCGKPLDRCETKYCSKKCYQEYKHKKFLDSLTYNKCIICGKPTLNDKYCSMKCLGKDESRKEQAIKNLNNEHSWSKNEIEYLKENYGILTLQEIEDFLQINKEAIIAYAHKHNIISKRKWTKDDLNYLKNNFDKDIEELSNYLHKTKFAILNEYARLNSFIDKDGNSIISPQQFIANYLESLNIDFKEEIKIGKYKTDIFVYGIDIEIQGTYWHFDKRFYNYQELSDSNKKKIESDKRKKEFLESINIPVFYIWEYDIFSNPQKVKNDIKELVNKYKKLYELRMGMPN